MTETAERPNVNYGDRDVAMANEILRTTVGSGLHGISVPGTDDHDEMGIFISPPEHVLGLVGFWPDGQSVDQYVSRTQPEGVGSGPGDTDLTIYALRKYLRLAAAGNPTVLLPLFAPTDKVLVSSAIGNMLRANRDWFLSQQAVGRFLGYLTQQRERFEGKGRQSRVPNREEVVRQYGYDTKYAAHTLRLAMQGLEVAQHGRLTLPMPENQRAAVMEVRQGALTKEQVLKVILHHENLLADVYAKKTSPLAKEPDWAAINDFSIYAHTKHWTLQADGRLSPG